MKGLSKVTAAVLAGGLGSRLRPILNNTPKVMAEVRGRPFLTYILDQLSVSDISNVVICVGYLGKQVQEAIGYSYRGLNLEYSYETSLLGTAGALRQALPLFESDPVLVMNGDTFCPIDFKLLWKWHKARKANVTLLLTKVIDTSRYGRVKFNDQGLIVEFQEKSSNSRPGWINAGTYVISHHILRMIPHNRSVSLEKDILPAMLDQRLYGYQGSGSFLDIGTPDSYAGAGPFFESLRT